MPTHYRTCHLCESMCGLAIELDGRTIKRVEGDRDDPFSRGHICPKALGLSDVHEDSDRLQTPVRRRGDRWTSISWEAAFDLVADRITDLQARHGRRSVATYSGNPVAHNYGSILHGQLFLREVRTPNNFSATSLDQLPHMLASLEMFGHQLRLPIPDVDRTKLMVIIGANPAVSNGSLMTAGDIKGALKGIRARGGRIVVIDPRRTETARLADEHVFIRPGSDAAFLAAVAHHVLFAWGPRLGRLAPHVDGLEAVKRAVAPFTPERVGATTGIDPAATRRLANALVSAEAAVLYGRVGVCTQSFGGLAGWLLNVINAITGRLDAPGGAMFPTPAVDLAGLASHIGKRGSFDRRRSRVHGWPEFGGEFPTPTLADEILTPGEGQIRGLVTSAGNPVLSSPDGVRLAKALDKLDFMASIDIYINETTRHADVILPPTFGLEHDHYDLIFHALAVRNSAKYSPAAWPRRPDQRHDWEIYTELARRLSARRPAKGLARVRRAVADPIYRLLGRVEPKRIIDLMLRGGPHRLDLKTLEAAPHGVDLGPMEPRLPEILETPNKRIQLAPPAFVDDLGRLERSLDQPRTSLSLIGRRSLRSNNSWMHNSHRFTKGRSTCTLLMHPTDAATRGFREGQRVKVSTEVGEITVPVELDDGMMPGVVSLPHGWGHHRDGARLRVAEQCPGVSANDVIRPEVDPLSGTARLTDVPVDVTAA